VQGMKLLEELNREAGATSIANITPIETKTLELLNEVVIYEELLLKE
jgi:hypothetical protein